MIFNCESCISPYETKYMFLELQHYENSPMQHTEIFSAVTTEHFIGNISIRIFNRFAQNIDCGYTLEPPHRGGSKEYPQTVLDQK